MTSFGFMISSIVRTIPNKQDTPVRAIVSGESASAAIIGDGDSIVRFDEAAMAYGEILALQPTTLAVDRGSVISLIGSNGSGKSTVLGLMAGLISPSSGTVSRAPRCRVGFVPQQHHHHRWMPLTVNEVISMGRFSRLGLLRPFRRVDRLAVATAAERLEVADLLRRPMSRLSGGQRQRVLVAQALVEDADLLLLDEPITGLDLASQRVILEVIGTEAARGAAVVFSTHHLDEARRADRVILLAGRVIADAPPDIALTTERLASAFGGRLITLDAATVVLDEHGHGIEHDDCDHLDPGAH